MEYHFTWCYQKYKAKSFFDADENINGVDIYEIDENDEQKYLGDMLGIDIPDTEDEDSCKDFKHEMGLWLTEYHDA